MWTMGKLGLICRQAATNRCDVFSSARRRTFTRQPRLHAVLRFRSDMLLRKPARTAPAPESIESAPRSWRWFLLHEEPTPPPTRRRDVRAQTLRVLQQSRESQCPDIPL